MVFRGHRTAEVFISLSEWLGKKVSTMFTMFAGHDLVCPQSPWVTSMSCDDSSQHRYLLFLMAHIKRVSVTLIAVTEETASKTPSLDLFSWRPRCSIPTASSLSLPSTSRRGVVSGLPSSLAPLPRRLAAVAVSLPMLWRLSERIVLITLIQHKCRA